MPADLKSIIADLVSGLEPASARRKGVSQAGAPAADCRTRVV
jgi:hypothetical protein